MAPKKPRSSQSKQSLSKQFARAARRIALSSRRATAQAVRVVDALISNAGAAIKAMVLTTDDSLEDILAETVAAAEQALREMKGEAAPPPPPPPAPSLKPWCGACELAGDGLRVAAGCAVANGSVAFYDADQKADTPVLSVACDAVAASYALGTDGVTFRGDELTYTVHFEDPGDVCLLYTSPSPRDA